MVWQFERRLRASAREKESSACEARLSYIASSLVVESHGISGSPKGQRITQTQTDHQLQRPVWQVSILILSVTLPLQTMSNLIIQHCLDGRRTLRSGGQPPAAPPLQGGSLPHFGLNSSPHSAFEFMRHYRPFCTSGSLLFRRHSGSRHAGAVHRTGRLDLLPTLLKPKAIGNGPPSPP